MRRRRLRLAGCLPSLTSRKMARMEERRRSSVRPKLAPVLQRASSQHLRSECECAIPEFSCSMLSIFILFFFLSSSLSRERALAWESCDFRSIWAGLYLCCDSKKAHTKQFDDDNLRSERSGIAWGSIHTHLCIIFLVDHVLQNGNCSKVSCAFLYLLSLSRSLQVCLDLSLVVSVSISLSLTVNLSHSLPFTASCLSLCLPCHVMPVSRSSSTNSSLHTKRHQKSALSRTPVGRF
jgi:hypothetical protein